MKFKIGKTLFFIILTTVLLVIGGIFYFLKVKAPIGKGTVVQNIQYNQNQSLDLYYPTSEMDQEKYPVLFYIHGGAWIVGSKITVNSNRFYKSINELRALGYFVISPDYTLAEDGQSPFPYCITDVFEALNWAQQNAEEYQFDLDNLGILGESAGAHIGMMVAFSEASDFNLDFEKPKIKYLIDTYGPSDLNSLYHSGTTDSLLAALERLPGDLEECLNIPRLLVGFDPNDDPGKAEMIMASLSPLKYLDSERIPTLIIHGLNDQIVPIEQSYELQMKLDSLGIEHKTLYIEGSNHAFIGASDEQREDVQQSIVNFIKSNNH